MTGGSVRDDLRRLPWWVAVALTVLALVVLALRAAGLAVAVVVTTAERLDVAAAIRAGISPLGASSWLVSTAVPAPDWTHPGGDR
ncbi:hypothetical protein [Candidatus Frankia alpina]|uniref:Uncharacterized protein n=1 Tax=Candidatus Frankia alpina TaxID=2699483 RepID=A0A4S5ETP7_9ACTN|nr:hypothetical protein [Candidatus Frankia alpina]THJ75861.1 hypothetical protein E7Y31_02965 [Candidatus Frankia alpina]